MVITNCQLSGAVHTQTDPSSVWSLVFDLKLAMLELLQKHWSTCKIGSIRKDCIELSFSQFIKSGCLNKSLLRKCIWKERSITFCLLGLHQLVTIQTSPDYSVLTCFDYIWILLSCFFYLFLDDSLNFLTACWGLWSQRFSFLLWWDILNTQVGHCILNYH